MNLKLEIVFFMCLMSVISCMGQPKKNDWELMNLTGKVKKIHDSYDFGISNTYFFDEKGMLEKIIRIVEHSQEKEVMTFAYELDNKGHKVKEYVYNLGKLSRYFIYSYNENGHKKEEKVYNPDNEPIEYGQYQYDEKGNLLESKNYYYPENKERHYKYMYDKEGRMIAFFVDGKKWYNYTYKFDNQGNWIEQTVFKEDKISYIIKREIEYY